MSSLLLGLLVLPACNGPAKETVDTAPAVGTLSVTLLLDHYGCEEDPKGHEFTLLVFAEGDYSTVAEVALPWGPPTDEELPIGAYQAEAWAAWKPDGTGKLPVPHTDCTCAGTIDGERHVVTIAAGRVTPAVIPVTCGFATY